MIEQGRETRGLRLNDEARHSTRRSGPLCYLLLTILCIAAVAAQLFLGNSGTSTNAHLLFGLLDRADFVTGYRLPFVFNRFTLSGRVTGGDNSGKLQVKTDMRRTRAAYPLVGTIATYR